MVCNVVLQFIEILVLAANSVEPDQTAFCTDLGLHCLLIVPFMES